MSHHEQSFATALSVLVQHGHIKQRLISAYQDNLGDIADDQLPIPMKQLFADLRHLMHREAPLNGEGAIRATVRKMSVADAEQCAQLIIELYGAVLRHGASSKTAAPRTDSDVPQVPPFLVKSG